MWLESSSQENVQDGLDGFDIPGTVFKRRIKRMLLTNSVLVASETDKRKKKKKNKREKAINTQISSLRP